MILTNCGRVTHICVSKLNIIDSDNELSPRPWHAIIWTNAGILIIRPVGTKFIEHLVEMHTFSFKKIHLKISPAKWRPFCLGLNVSMILRLTLLVHVLPPTRSRASSTRTSMPPCSCRSLAPDKPVENNDPLLRHQMETFSVLLALCAGNSPVTSEFPLQRPVTRSFDVFFDLGLNKLLSKRLWLWWFEMPSRSLWRHL